MAGKLFFISFLFSSFSLIQAAPDLSDYPFYRDIVTVPERQELAAVIPDSVIWEEGETMPGMRIVTNTLLPAPHIFKKAEESRMVKVRESRKASISKLEEKKDNSVELFIDIIEKTGTANLLEVKTPLKDFERIISVKGVGTDGKEVSLADNVPIYDYSRFADIRHTTIELPPNEFRRFRVNISSLTDEILSPNRHISKTLEGDSEIRRTEESDITSRNFRIDAILIYYEHETEAQKVEKTARLSNKSFKLIQDDGEKNTILEIETYNQPLNGLTIETPENNFSRRITVEVPVKTGQKEKWDQIIHATVSRISFRDFNRSELKVEFSERQLRRFRVVINNEDNPPLNISGITLYGPVWRALFLTEQGESLKLFYGSPLAQTVKQDTEPVKRILESGFEPVEFKIGKVENNPDYRKPDTSKKESWTDFFGSKTFFIIAAGLMVLAIAFALIRSAKRIQV
jgi:hypothetical protein